MIIQTYEYDTTVAWSYGQEVYLSSSNPCRWGLKGIPVSEAKVRKPPTANSCDLHIEISEESLRNALLMRQPSSF